VRAARALQSTLNSRFSRVPIRMKLMLAFAGVLAVLFGGLALLLYSRFSAGLDNGIQSSLRARAADLTPVAGEQTPHLAERGFPITTGGVAQILDAHGRVLAFSPASEKRSLLSLSTLNQALRDRATVDNDDQQLRLLARRVPAPTPRVLVVGVSLADRDHALGTLRGLMFVGGPIGLFLACLAGYGLAARALAPVERMRRRAARIGGSIGGSDYHARLPLPEAQDEIHRLGETLNAMLARLEELVARERALVAGASHELRTPLTILLLELGETLSSDDRTREELMATIRSVSEEVGRLASLAEDLLVVARADQGRLPIAMERVEVHGILRPLAERYAQLDGIVGRSVVVDQSEPIIVEADVGRIHQALANMVDNALRYGEGQVRLRASEHGECIELHVIDEGQGFPPDFLARAFERFSRADPARQRGGVGLGLSIVRAIAEAHGGRADAENRATGGAHVWLTLPRTGGPRA
jgi:two-component system OmpR family sensor kinase